MGGGDPRGVPEAARGERERAGLEAPDGVAQRPRRHVRQVADGGDRTVAPISHLPHVAAWALGDAVGRFEPGALAFAARGFRDTTRVAASHPPMWRDILLAHADAGRASLDRKS